MHEVSPFPLQCSPNAPSFRRAGLMGLAIAVALSSQTASGLAGESTERPFNPPVGSRWIIETERNTIEARPEGSRSSQIRSRAELTIEAKTADGFRVTYVHRSATAEGNDPRLPLIRSAIQALDNVPVRAITDMSGKPMRVENLDEARAAVRVMAGKLTEPFKDKPQVVAALNQVMAGLIDVDADTAAKTYLDELPQIAIAQNTGMKPGEKKVSSETVSSPLGGTLKTSSSFQLSETDAATGRRVYVSTTAYDAASMKAFIQSLSARVVASAGNSAKPEQIESIVKQMEVSLDRRAVFDVEDGMTRRITEKSVIVARAMGRSLEKTETRTTAVSRAP